MLFMCALDQKEKIEYSPLNEVLFIEKKKNI